MARKLFARSSIPFAVLVGLALAAPAQAQDPLHDVAALEARLEAAGELAELPTEPDWGATDAVASDADSLASAAAPAEDAPEAPVDSASEPVADATEPRYHAREPQYHAEYHSSVPEPAAPEVAPAAEDSEPVAEAPAPPVADARETPPPVTAPEATEAPTAAAVAAPVTTAAPAQTPAPAAATPSPTPAATPTIWIWIWNWSWTTVIGDRYQNSGSQYQIDEPVIDPTVGEIVKNIGVEMPVQIGVRKGSDIVAEVEREIAPEQTVRDVLAEATKDTPVENVLAPAAEPPAPPASSSSKTRGERSKAESAPRKRQAGRRAKPSESTQRVLLDSVTSSATYSATYFASGDVARASRHSGRSSARVRMHRAAATKSALPTNDERLADSGTASGPNAGFVIKTSAILAAFLMLAALAYGRRIWLPVARLRGLLGSRTEPPG